MRHFIIDVFAVIGLRYVIDAIADLIDELRRKRRWKRLQAQREARIDALLAIPRDKYDGRPL